MRVPWTARRSSQSILKELSPGVSLLGPNLCLPHCEHSCNQGTTGRLRRYGLLKYLLGFPGGSAGKESGCNVGDLGLIPGCIQGPVLDLLFIICTHFTGVIVQPLGFNHPFFCYMLISVKCIPSAQTFILNYRLLHPAAY